MLVLTCTMYLGGVIYDLVSEAVVLSLPFQVLTVKYPSEVSWDTNKDGKNSAAAGDGEEGEGEGEREGGGGDRGCDAEVIVCATNRLAGPGDNAKVNFTFEVGTAVYELLRGKQGGQWEGKREGRKGGWREEGRKDNMRSAAVEPCSGMICTRPTFLFVCFLVFHAFDCGQGVVFVSRVRAGWINLFDYLLSHSTHFYVGVPGSVWGEGVLCCTRVCLGYFLRTASPISQYQSFEMRSFFSRTH